MCDSVEIVFPLLISLYLGSKRPLTGPTNQPVTRKVTIEFLWLYLWFWIVNFLIWALDPLVILFIEMNVIKATYMSIWRLEIY